MPARTHILTIGWREYVSLPEVGIDVLRSNYDALVLEVNSSPGLEGIEGATELDIAGKIIEFIEKYAKGGKQRDRGKG